MTQIQQYNFSKKDGEICVRFARDALRKYTIEGQRLDVGSVEEPLNKRGGVLIRLESEGLFGSQLKGNAAIYDGRRLSDAIIDSIIYASSSRSIGSEIKKSEIDDIKIQLSLIEKVTLTKKPSENITIGEDCFIIPKELGIWLYPTKPVEYDWTPEEYINRTYRSSQLNEEDWSDKNVVIAEVSSFVEQNPNGRPIIYNPK